MLENNKPQDARQTSSGAEPIFVSCPKCGLRLSPNIAKCPQDGTTIPKRVVSEFAEKYEILEEIGTGGMSVIYKARQRALGRIVAIKMLHAHLINELATKRFQQEAKAVSLLHHPNIVAVYDFGLSDEGRPYMVMDFVDGKTLSQVLDQVGELTVDRSIAIFIQVSDALNYAHLKGILHRDLKPSNIMITHSADEPLIAKLVDFGIAKMTEDEGAQKLTQTGELFGSPLYMSPEQCMGKVLDRRSDIYAFGCLMHECLTGEPPHIGDTVVETMSKRIHDQAPLIGEIRRDKRYPAKLEDIVDKTLQKNPDSRYQSMQELKASLENLQSELSSGAAAAASTQKMIVRKVTRNTRLHVAVVSILAALLLLAGSVKFVQMRQEHAAKESEQRARREARRKAELLPSMDHRKISAQILEESLCYDAGLERLDLSYSPVQDPVLKYVANQSNLKELNLQDAKNVSNEGLKNISGLSQLRYLNLEGTAVSDKGLEYLQGMKELRRLNLEHTKGIFGSGLKYLAGLPHLERLDLERSAISGNCLAPLKTTALELLYLDGTHVKDDTIAGLANFEHLKDLQICIDSITDKSAGAIGTLGKLEGLGLAAKHITDNSAPEIARLSNLKRLDLSWTQFTKKGLSLLTELPNLESLSVEGLWGAKEKSTIDDQAAEVIAKMPKLSKLYISKGRMTAKGLDSLAKLPITELWFADADHDCVASLGKFHALKKLHLKDAHLEKEDQEKLTTSLPYCQIDVWKWFGEEGEQEEWEKWSRRRSEER
jgi:serine/threonine protein kinase